MAKRLNLHMDEPGNQAGSVISTMRDRPHPRLRSKERLRYSFQLYGKQARNGAE